MRRHKYLRRLERLYNAVLDYYNGEPNHELPEDEGLWLIWCALEKDIKKCGLSPDYKIDGVRLYYYNELWKKINDKDHEPFPKDGVVPRSHDPRAPKWAQTLMDEFEDPMERAEWLAKQPLPGYIWTEAK
jgi:hypothetical protein